ncbi:hypothetical protein RND71_044242 [Anisodus tanguticus]|uniref:Piwi domain-containing protein n=1 Tax=Anisodus tanguticus TaxID=243964 RepID=A0AAE1QNN9_9SOLA|nr:hypothetical protein RND71_044242 [Anisodus tanguticus]
MDAPTRQREIMSLVRSVNYNNEEFVKEYGLKLSTEMDKVEARVLPPPMVQYDCNSFVTPRKGAWDMRDKQFFMGSCIKQWAVICFCPITVVKENSLSIFIDKLIKISAGAGMPILSKPNFCKYTTDAKRVAPIFNFLKRSLKSLQLVVFVLPGKTNLYSEIKRVGDTMFGIATQCVQSKNVNHIKFQALANICLKINVKLGGINSIICPYNRSRVFNEPIIFFGIDVSTVSEPNRPKLVSVVASMDAHPSKYIARIDVQSNKVDEVKNLSEMVKELLIQFYKETYFKPHRFVFYRQGIPNSKLEPVFNKELLAIRDACLKLEQGYRPGITYIFLQKRHHTRLFCKDLSDREGISGNVPAGTIVDQGITSPVEFDFFLCSHSGVQQQQRTSAFISREYCDMPVITYSSNYNSNNHHTMSSASSGHTLPKYSSTTNSSLNNGSIYNFKYRNPGLSSNSRTFTSSSTDNYRSILSNLSGLNKSTTLQTKSRNYLNSSNNYKNYVSTSSLSSTPRSSISHSSISNSSTSSNGSISSYNNTNSSGVSSSSSVTLTSYSPRRSSLINDDFKTSTNSLKTKNDTENKLTLEEVKNNTSDEDLEEAIEEFQPNLIIYNAGADVLMNDPLGGLDLTSDGVIRRDEMVFRYAKKNNISVAMLTSGGYHPDNSQLISDSIKNLFAKGYINRINLVN